MKDLSDRRLLFSILYQNLYKKISGMQFGLIIIEINMLGAQCLQ